MIGIGVACASAGLIVGAITLTALAFGWLQGLRLRRNNVGQAGFRFEN